MAVQLSVTVRNARLDAVESTIGTAPTLEIRSGSQPADCAASDSGTLLASMTLPSDWMSAASSGIKSKSGTWQDTSADASGTAGHFRIKKSGVCHMQGSVGMGSGDLQLNDTALLVGQIVTITLFSLGDGNA